MAMFATVVKSEESWKHHVTAIRENTNYRVWFGAGIIALLGIALLWFSAKHDRWKDWESLQIVVRESGALLLVTAAVTLLWEFFGKRRFLDEILLKVGMAKSLDMAGITELSSDFNRIGMGPYFQKVKELDIFVAWAYTWRSANRADLAAVASRQDSRIRVFLPNPENHDVVDEMARRFDLRTDQVSERIREAKTDFDKLNSRGQVEVRFVDTAPVFSFYRFDDTAIVAFYSHRKGKPSVPAIICNKDGWFYRFVRDEFKDLEKMKALMKERSKV